MVSEIGIRYLPVLQPTEIEMPNLLSQIPVIFVESSFSPHYSVD
jgi:hypothetical protein